MAGVASMMKKKTNRTKPLPLNTRKRIVTQKPQTNPISQPSITALRRTKTQRQPTIKVKRDMSPVKLPPITQKTSSTNIKSAPSAYLHGPSRLEKPTAIIINQPRPRSLIKPIFVQKQLPSIKERTIKENLTQKATLKCKSPRPESAFSRSTTFVAIEPSHHPLQHMDVGSLLSESARNRLKRLFKRLDTDKDGHLIYTQVQRCLPSSLHRAQMTFFRVLYDLISNTTFFGLQEFYATAIIVEIVAKQDSTLWDTFLDDVDFNYYHDNILQLLEEFNNQCSSITATITYEHLLQLIIQRTTNGKTERISMELERIIPGIKTMKINRLDFIATLPAIIYIESCLDHERLLFRFRENSILDTHIRRAILT